MITRNTFKNILAGILMLYSSTGISFADTLEKSRNPTIQEAAKILSVPEYNIENLNAGYKASASDLSRLNTLAGICAGTVKVKRTRNGCFMRGYYSYFQNPKAMSNALELADRNNDKIVSTQEISNLEEKFCNYFSK